MIFPRTQKNDCSYFIGIALIKEKFTKGENSYRVLIYSVKMPLIVDEKETSKNVNKKVIATKILLFKTLSDQIEGILI